MICPNCGVVNAVHQMLCAECGSELWLLFTITLPPDSKWAPERAEQLITHLIADFPFKLIIRARQNQIKWQLMVPPGKDKIFAKYFYALYPEGVINSEQVVNLPPKAGIEIPHKLLPLHAVEHFPYPFMTLSELRDRDPLIPLVGAMTGVEQGEEIVYQLAIKPPEEKDYAAEGHKWLRRGAPFWVHVAGAVIQDHSLPDKYREAQSPKELKKLAEQKLGQRLVEVDLTLDFVNFPEGQMGDTNWNRMIAVAAPLGEGTLSRPNSNCLTVPNPDDQKIKTHPLVLSPGEIAALWHMPYDQFEIPGIEFASTITAPLPAQLIGKTSDIHLGDNISQGETTPVYLAYPDRVTHINIVGKTRVGKTTLLHHLIHQDIAEGKGVGVIDPHGDLIRAILETSIPPEREDDVVLFDLADSDHPIGLNLLAVPEGVPRHAAVGSTLSVLKRMFADQWSATRMEDALYSALSVLVEVEGASIRDLPRLFNNPEYRHAALRATDDDVALDFWHDDYERLSERYQREIARPILTRVRRFYRNPVVKQIVCQINSLDFREIMDKGKILLASLASNEAQSEAGTIGALLISKLQIAAMSRAPIPPEKRQMFYLTIDEVQNFITTSLSTVFSEAGKYALSLTVANQYLRQLEGGTLEAIMGNTGTTIMFACGHDDARDLGAYVKPVFDSGTLLNLDRFQTVVKMQLGGQTIPAFSMMTLPPPPRRDDARERAGRIKELSRKKYARRKEEVDEEIRKHYQVIVEDEQPPTTYYEEA